MKSRMILAALAALMVVSMVSMIALAGNEETGNGCPSGPHYNLNLIGVPKEKSADGDGSSGHRIFIKLTGNTKINLIEGADYAVLDYNGTDGTAAFQLPNPDPDGDGVTVYSVFCRVVGKPNGTGSITPEVYDADGVGWIASEVSLPLGKSQKFDNVSRELLYVVVGGVRYPLFDDEYQGYLWSVDNNGCKVVQLRFYEIETDVN